MSNQEKQNKKRDAIKAALLSVKKNIKTGIRGGGGSFLKEGPIVVK